MITNARTHQITGDDSVHKSPSRSGDHRLRGQEGEVFSYQERIKQ